MKVCVIGAGPAGLMAAGKAASLGAKTILIEKNEKAGKKLYITGKGRCNVTNDSNTEMFLQNVVSNAKFLYSAMNIMRTQDTVRFFGENGVLLKLERGGRYFPVSEKASDITKGLLNYVKSQEMAEIRYDTTVRSIEKDGKFTVKTDGEDIICDKVIIATGGVSYPLTGSTGDGYTFACAFGHTIIDPVPALAAIDIKESYPELEGLSLKNVTLSFVNGYKYMYKQFGEMLFTSTGISGPMVLTISSYINRKNYTGAQLSIDLKPALDPITLDNRVLADFDLNMNKMLKNSLDALLPKSLVLPVINKAGIDPDKSVNVITKDERIALVTALKDFRLTIAGLDSLDKAVVTAGGVCVKEIHPGTCESKLVPGLFFAGEVLDVDGLTGGFNIQIALSTGCLAGYAAVKK